MDFEKELQEIEKEALSIKGDTLTKCLFVEGVARGAIMVAQKLAERGFDFVLLDHQLSELRGNVFRKG